MIVKSGSLNKLLDRDSAGGWGSTQENRIEGGERRGGGGEGAVV